VKCEGTCLEYLSHLRVPRLCHEVNLKVTVTKQRQHAGLGLPRTQLNYCCFIGVTYVAHAPQPPRSHLITDDVLEKKREHNTAALVTIAQCNTFVVRCSRQLIGLADWALSHWDPYAVISLEAVAYS